MSWTSDQGPSRLSPPGRRVREWDEPPGHGPPPNLTIDVSVTSATSVIESGRERLRAGPWRGDPATAYLNPVPGAPLPSTDFVRRCLRTLAGQGYRRVVTGALSPAEQSAFRAAGFGVTEH